MAPGWCMPPGTNTHSKTATTTTTTSSSSRQTDGRWGLALSAGFSCPVGTRTLLAVCSLPGWLDLGCGSPVASIRWLHTHSLSTAKSSREKSTKKTRRRRIDSCLRVTHTPIPAGPGALTTSSEGPLAVERLVDAAKGERRGEGEREKQPQRRLRRRYNRKTRLTDTP